MWIRRLKWPNYGYLAGVAALGSPKAYVWLLEQRITGQEG